MNKIRFLFLTVLCVLGFSAHRAEAQIAGQTMTFSIICEYVTNTYKTNIQTSEITAVQHLQTVLISSANMVRSLTTDLFGRKYTNQGTSHIDWNIGHLIYEQNLTNGAQGVFLRAGHFQTDVSSYFINTNLAFNGYPVLSNGYSNLFSVGVSDVYSNLLYQTNSSLPIAQGYVYNYTTNAAEAANETNDFTLYDNLAYVNFDTTNAQFKLFGYSQGHLIGVPYEGKYTKLNQAQIVASGTFQMNFTTNLLDVVDGQVVTNVYHSNITYIITNAAPPLFISGLAHGTINFSAPYLIPGVTNGPGQTNLVEAVSSDQ